MDYIMSTHLRGCQPVDPRESGSIMVLCMAVPRGLEWIVSGSCLGNSCLENLREAAGSDWLHEDARQ